MTKDERLAEARALLERYRRMQGTLIERMPHDLRPHPGVINLFEYDVRAALAHDDTPATVETGEEGRMNKLRERFNPARDSGDMKEVQNIAEDALDLLDEMAKPIQDYLNRRADPSSRPTVEELEKILQSASSESDNIVIEQSGEIANIDAVGVLKEVLAKYEGKS